VVVLPSFGERYLSTILFEELRGKAQQIPTSLFRIELFLDELLLDELPKRPRGKFAERRAGWGARLLRFGASRVEMSCGNCPQTVKHLAVSANCRVYDGFPTSQLGLQEQTGGGPGRNRL